MSKPHGQSEQRVPCWMWGAGLVLAVLIAYLPVAWAGFIWDDDLMLTDNGVIIGPYGLKEIWTTNAADVCPLTLTTLWAEFKLWGFWALPYHIETVLFHAGSAVVLWQVLRRLAIPGAWLGAAIWALHPVQVESVAWIAEIKNTQSGLFFLFAIYFFLGSIAKEVDAPPPPKAQRNYILMLVFAVLAMASKSSTAILPLVLCLAAWWKQGAWNWRTMARLAPVMVMMLIAAMISVSVQASRGAEGLPVHLSWPEKFIVAGISFWFYLGKLAWPNPLMILFPKWDMHPEWIASYLPFAAVVAVGIFLLVGRNGNVRPIFFAYAFFLSCLLPVMGFFDLYSFRYSFVMDHFQYLASMGPLALVGSALYILGTKLLAAHPWVRTSLAVWLLVALGGMSLAYSRTFKNEFTLWTDEQAKDPQNPTAYNQLGIEYYKQGDNIKAMSELEKAVELNPEDAKTQSNLGLLFTERGQFEAAMSHFQKALQIDPNYGRAHFAIANLLAKRGHTDDAIQEYEHALLTDPHEADIRVAYGVALAKKGQMDDAHKQLEQAVVLDPSSAEAHFYYGNILMQEQRHKEALDQYHAAQALRPNDPGVLNVLAQASAANGDSAKGVEEAKAAIDKDPTNATLRFNLAHIYAMANQPDETIQALDEGLKISPNNAEAHDLRASALMAKGKVDEAIPEYRKAIEIDSKFAQGYADLGFVLFQQGNTKEAIGLYNHALELKPNDALMHNNLGIIYAQAGQFPQARAQFSAALKIDPDNAEAKRNVQRLEALAGQAGNGAKRDKK